MSKLDDGDVDTRLAALPEWRREGDEIVREYRFESFPAAVAFVNRVAERAEAADHHPDLDIRYRNVRVALSTHSAGGLTEKDFALADEIEACSRES